MASKKEVMVWPKTGESKSMAMERVRARSGTNVTLVWGPQTVGKGKNNDRHFGNTSQRSGEKFSLDRGFPKLGGGLSDKMGKYFLGPKVTSDVPVRGAETHLMTASTLDSHFRSAFAGEGEFPRQRCYAAPATFCALDTVADCCYEGLVSHSPHTGPVLCPSELRLLFAWCTIAIRACGEASLQVDGNYSRDDCRDLCYALGHIELPAVMWEYLARLWPRQHRGLSYYCPVESYTGGSTDTIGGYRFDTAWNIIEQNVNDAKGIAALEAVDATVRLQPGGKLPPRGLRFSRESYGNVPKKPSFGAGSRTLMSDILYEDEIRYRWADALSVFRRTKKGAATFNTVGVNFETLYRNAAAYEPVRAPVSLLIRNPASPQNGEMRCAGFLDHEVSLLDWAFLIREQRSGRLIGQGVVDNTVTNSMPELASTRVAPYSIHVFKHRDVLISTCRFLNGL